MDRSENLLTEVDSYGEIGYEWAFRILKEKYKERPGEAIRGLMAQLEGTNHVIYQELEEGVQDPEGERGWLSKKRGDLQSLGRCLTNREIYDYFIKRKIVLDYRFFQCDKKPLPDSGIR